MNETEILTVPSLIQYNPYILAITIRKEKDTRMRSIERENSNYDFCRYII